LADRRWQEEIFSEFPVGERSSHDEEVQEAMEDAGGDAPDGGVGAGEAPKDRLGKRVDEAVTELVGSLAIEAGVVMPAEKVGDGYLEDRSDFGSVRPRRMEAGPPADESANGDARGVGGKEAEVAEAGDDVRLDADFFGEFAIGGGQGAGIVGLDVAAGKGDLPGPGVAELGSTNEKEVRLVAIDEEGEDGRGAFGGGGRRDGGGALGEEVTKAVGIETHRAPPGQGQGLLSKLPQEE
jgi:hypothetical protein